LQPHLTPRDKAREAIDLLCDRKNVTRASLNNALASIPIDFQLPPEPDTRMFVLF
jgi:hypothetical protein